MKNIALEYTLLQRMILALPPTVNLSIDYIVVSEKLFHGSISKQGCPRASPTDMEVDLNASAMWVTFLPPEKKKEAAGKADLLALLPELTLPHQTGVTQKAIPYLEDYTSSEVRLLL